MPTEGWSYYINVEKHELKGVILPNRIKSVVLFTLDVILPYVIYKTHIKVHTHQAIDYSFFAL